ncbi:hypothetical protein AB0M54_29005 [Actinoplanes sp. NPDC051470]|uniref:hypothetical protein n=1 Tax=unclassified Actinoplanes TaxID=2626549 RepID=UPI00343BF52B
MAGWNIVPADVYTGANNVAQAGQEASDAWEANRGAIEMMREAVGPRGDDRLANAFYSGYSHREGRLLRDGESIPRRFRERSDVGRDSARLAREAEDAAQAAMSAVRGANAGARPR